MKSVIEKNGGDYLFYQVGHYLLHDASYEMRSFIDRRISHEFIYSASSNDTLDPKAVIKEGVRDYLIKNPEQYNPVFESFFNNKERRNLAFGLRGAA